MEFIINILNRPLNRLVISFIISGTVACPYINGFSPYVGWLVIGICLFVLTILSVISDYDFTEKHRIHIIIFALAFVAFLAFVFFTWGR